MPHIDFKVTTWFRIPIEEIETMDKLIAAIKGGRVMGSSDAHAFIAGAEGDPRWKEIDCSLQTDMEPSENEMSATIEVYEDDTTIRLHNGIRPNVIQDDGSFVAHGTYTVSNAGGYEIQLSDDGDSARVRDAYGGEFTEISDWIQLISKKVNGKWTSVIKVDSDLEIPINEVMIVPKEK